VGLAAPAAAAGPPGKTWDRPRTTGGTRNLPAGAEVLRLGGDEYCESL
jgi:hypothetical protein